MNKRVKLLSLSSAFGLGLSLGAAPLPSFAQSNTEVFLALEEIVVTSRRREESLLDVPISVSVFGAQQIDRLNIDDFEDLANFDPSLEFTTNNTPRDIRPAIRGLRADRGRSNLGILIDGIDITSENFGSPGTGFLGNLRLIDVERIEVVKGPQSALYGRSAFAGAINYVTKRPGDTYEASLNAEAGSYGLFDVKGRVSGPVIEDQLSLGLNAFYYRDNGAHVSNNGGRVGGGDEAGVALSVLLTPNEALSFYGRVEYSDGSADPLATATNQATNTTVSLGPLAQSVLQAVSGNSSTSGVTFRGTLEDAPTLLLPDPRTGEDFAGSDYDTLRATLNSTWEGESVTFEAMTSYLEQDYFQNVDQTLIAPNAGGLVPSFFQFATYGSSTSQFSQEVRLSSSGEGRFQWLVGGLYWHEDADAFNNQAIRVFGFPVPSIVAQELDFVQNAPPRVENRTTEHLSAFVWSELEVTDSLFVAAEVRYSDETIDYSLNGQTYVFGSNFFSPGAINILTAPSNSEIESTESFVTPKFTLRYSFDEDSSVYASAARGIKPAGVNTIAVANFSDAARFNTEKLWAYEVGAKANLLDRTVNLSGALFYMDYTDQQVGTTRFSEVTQTVSPSIDNAGESHVLGAEFSGTWQPTEEFTLSGAYTFLDSEFDSFEIGTTSFTAITNAGGECSFTEGTGASSVCVVDLAGNELPTAPKHSFVFTGSYQAPLGFLDGLDGLAELTVRHTGSRFAEAENNITLPSYTRVDVRMGVVSDRWQAIAYVNNLTDSDTVTRGFAHIDGAQGFARTGMSIRPDPLRFGLRLGLRL